MLASAVTMVGDMKAFESIMIEQSRHVADRFQRGERLFVTNGLSAKSDDFAYLFVCGRKKAFDIDGGIYYLSLVF